MAPATVQALRRIAEASATSAKSAVFETTGFRLDADLRCELLGEALSSNLQLGNLSEQVPHRTRLLFLYRCVNCHSHAVALHDVGCNKVVMRGSVPLRIRIRIIINPIPLVVVAGFGLAPRPRGPSWA